MTVQKMVEADRLTSPALMTDSALMFSVVPEVRLKADLRLELRQVYFALLDFTHGFPVSCDSVLLKLLPRIQGPL